MFVRSLSHVSFGLMEIWGGNGKKRQYMMEEVLQELAIGSNSDMKWEHDDFLSEGDDFVAESGDGDTLYELVPPVYVLLVKQSGKCLFIKLPTFST